MIKFPSIREFSAVCKHIKERYSYRGRDANNKPIYDPAAVLPTLKFRGLIKIHGTNAAITMVNNSIQFQSRERELTVDKDHFGLMETYTVHHERLRNLFLAIKKFNNMDEDDGTPIAIFGEWAGENIQGKASIAVLPKFFTVIAVKIGDEWQNIDDYGFVKDHDIRIFNVNDFPRYAIIIDFNRAKLSQNEIVAITKEVEANCPIAEFFNIKGIGEGVVWSPVGLTDPDMIFKVKGQEHSNSKVKVLNAVDGDEIQRHYDFVDKVTNEPRMDQGLHNLIHEQLKPFDESSLGLFIRWVYGDIVKEETELMEEFNIDKDKIGKPVSDICKRWYIAKLKEQKG